jgi:hypothetical protein
MEFGGDGHGMDIYIYVCVYVCVCVCVCVCVTGGGGGGGSVFRNHIQETKIFSAGNCAWNAGQSFHEVFCHVILQRTNKYYLQISTQRRNVVTNTNSLIDQPN